MAERAPAWATVRAIAAVTGRPVSLRAIALGAVVGIPAAIVFSPSGVRARDVVPLLDRTLGVRLAVWLGWLLLSAPVTRAAFEAPGTAALRAYHLPRATTVAALGAIVLLGQVPWALLFARGAGPIAAFGAVALAIGIEAAAFAAARRRAYALAVAGGLAVVVAAPPAVITAALGSVLAAASIHGAWRTASEQPALARPLIRPTHPLVALYATHALRLVRSARPRLVLAAMLTSAGGAGLFTIDSERVDPTRRAFGVMTIPLVLVAALCVAPVLESEQRIRGLLRSLRVRRGLVVGAFLAAVATPGTALASTAVVVARTAVPASTVPLSLAITLGAWSAALAFVVGTWGRLHERTKVRSSGVFAAGVIAIAIVTMVGVCSC